MSNLAIAHQAEGMTIQRLQEKSAEKVGSMDEWRKAVQAKLDGDKAMEGPAKFLRDRNWTGADATKPQDTGAFDELIKAQGYSSAKNGLPSSLNMMSHLGSGLIYDTGWQPRTSVSYVTRYTAADKKAGIIPKGKDIGDSKTESFTNPEEEPGIVARPGVDAGMGSFVRLGDASNPLRYARVIDGKPGGSEAAEINIAAGQNLGDTSFNPNAASGQVDVETVANSGAGGGGLELSEGARLGNEQTQYAGWLADVKKEPYSAVSSQSALSKTMDKYKDDEAFKKYQSDVKEALRKQKEALEKAKQEKKLQNGGGDKVKQGLIDVLGGKDRKQVVLVGSPTEGGDALKEGRFGTYGGPQQLPISTLGSVTVKGQAVVTALEDVWVFGAPTSSSA
jgi:hypothetical protein